MSVKPNSAPWIVKSNQIFEEVSLAMGEIYPESASGLGYRQFDARVNPVGLAQRQVAKDFFAKHIDSAAAKIAAETDANVLTDLEILKDSFVDSKKSVELDEKYGVVDVCLLSRRVFQSLYSLLNSQSPKERKLAAVDRFKFFVNGDDKRSSYATECEKQVTETLALANPKQKLWPYKKETEQYLKDSKGYVQGIEEALKTSGRDDWSNEFLKFTKQVESYNRFVRIKVLPNARKQPQMPKEIYAHQLKLLGFDQTPEELIESGQMAYAELYKEFTSLANQVAVKLKIEGQTPVQVVQKLKQDQVTSTSKVEELYRESSRRITEIVLQEKLLTLPSEPLRIRIAGEAESLAQPIPHVDTPPFVNNVGERPEFVVPVSNGKIGYDDFSHRSAAIGLTAHEGRPGHDLQFRRMLDGGVSLIRATYAFNTVNVEGWALFAEDMIFPFITIEEKLFGLQMRLWRIARSFLDPQIQLGLIKDQRVISLFTQELGVSEQMAQFELRRYTFESPGQAPSYFYGYTLIKQAETVAKAQWPRFSKQCFNDRLLDMGLLPLTNLKKRIELLADCP